MAVVGKSKDVVLDFQKLTDHVGKGQLLLHY